MNVLAIALALNPVFHSREQKHIEVNFHYIWKKALRHDLCVKFISGKDNYVDVFTKPLLGPHFLFLWGKLLVDSSSCLRGMLKPKTKTKHQQLQRLCPSDAISVSDKPRV